MWQKLQRSIFNWNFFSFSQSPCESTGLVPKERAYISCVNVSCALTQCIVPRYSELMINLSMSCQPKTHRVKHVCWNVFLYFTSDIFRNIYRVWNKPLSDCAFVDVKMEQVGARILSAIRLHQWGTWFKFRLCHWLSWLRYLFFPPHSADPASWYTFITKTNKMHFYFLIYFNNSSSTCFEQSNYSSSGGSYVQHLVFTVLKIYWNCVKFCTISVCFHHGK